MTIAEIVALAGAALTLFGSIGATVRWAAGQFRTHEPVVPPSWLR